MPLHRIVTAYAAFGVVTDDNGTVVEAAPIGRRYVGRSLREVNRRVIELRGTIEQLPERTPPQPRAGSSVSCPRCGEVPYAVSDETGRRLPAGWRRCVGPRGCNHTWMPATVDLPVTAPAVPEHRRVWHGELVSDETGIVVWTCPHDHLNAETAKRCALTRTYGYYPPSLRRQQPANQKSIA